MSKTIVLNPVARLVVGGSTLGGAPITMLPAPPKRDNQSCTRSSWLAFVTRAIASGEGTLGSGAIAVTTGATGVIVGVGRAGSGVVAAGGGSDTATGSCASLLAGGSVVRSTRVTASISSSP